MPTIIYARTGACVRARRLLIPAALATAVSVFMLASGADAAQPPVGLGTAASFAVLAGSGITNTGPTTITGDIGTFPTTTETGTGSITLTGTDHAGDAVTQGAKSNLLTAYGDAAGRTPATNVPVELGGTTLHAGVYTHPTLGLTGTLTLDGQGNSAAEFIFQAGSTITTAPNSRVLLINGAQACHVTWQIGSSATFNTGTRFVGDVLAHTSITANTAATFQGRLLARDGAVTLDTNTITRSTCAAPTTSTATTLTASPATSSTPGTPIVLTAKVTAMSGIATGTVTFADNTTVLGSKPLTGGSASFTVPTPAAGTHLYTATYTASGGFTNSSTASALSHTVTAAAVPVTPIATVPTTPATATAQRSSSGLTASAQDTQSLPRTGTPTEALAAAGTALLGAGVTVIAVTRRRTRS